MLQRPFRSTRLLALCGAVFLMAAPADAQAPAPAPAAAQPARVPEHAEGIYSSVEALAAAPKVKISNGVIDAVVLVPDHEKGFYKGVRFDLAGMIPSLKVRGQEFYGLWFDGIAANLRDYVFQDGKIIAAPNTAALGPSDAYDTSDPPGWKDAAPGGLFLKIGVGMLRKPTDGQPYNSFRAYELVDAGKWTVQARKDGVVFTHTLGGPGSDYGYVYRKELRLAPGKPVLEIRHSLKNTGKAAIASSTFNHNFFPLGGLPTKAGLTVSAPYALEPTAPLKEAAKIEGGKLVYARALQPQEVFSTNFKTAEGAPYDFGIHDAEGTGYRAQSDRPVTRLLLWSIRSTVSVEPYVDIKAAPGQTTDWTFTYTYAAPPRA